jgi:ubiquinone/menaquinone biosynthesis C-methylase UbiE
MTEAADLEAVRAAYDEVADLYAQLFADSLASRPVDRGLLAAFAELAAAGGKPVADVGCGPGHLTDHLAGLGLDVVGVDLSPAMISLARNAYPGLPFTVASMASLDQPDEAFSGIVSWYSIIHTAPDSLPPILAEFHRLLEPGGQLLVAFQTTDKPDGPPIGFDHKVTPGHRWPVNTLAALLTNADFTETTRLIRPADASYRFPEARLLLTRSPEMS